MNTKKIVLMGALVALTGVRVCADANENLRNAVKSGDFNRVRDEIEQGANVDSPNEKGVTSLMLAAEKGNAEIVQLLLAKGKGFTNVQDKKGYTALMYAAKKGNAEIVKLLLPYDSPRTMAYEPSSDTALSLAEGEDDPDYDYDNNGGPKYPEVVKILNEALRNKNASKGYWGAAH